MKSLFKLLSITLLITTCAAFGAEQSAAEREFARQQDAKRLSQQASTAVADRALAAQIQQEEEAALQADLKKDAGIMAQDDEGGQAIKTLLLEQGRDAMGQRLTKLAELPIHVLHNVLEFHCGDPAKLKYIAANMHKLIPAIMMWPSQNIYLFQTIKACQTSNFVTEMRKHNAAYSHGCEIVRPSSLQSARNEKNGFVAYRMPDSKQQNKTTKVFKVCPEKFNLLNSLSLKQLRFLVQLYDMRQQILDSFRGPEYIIRSKIETPEEVVAFYNAFPEAIRACLQHNYGSPTDNHGDPAGFVPLPHRMEVQRPLRVVILPPPQDDQDQGVFETIDDGQDSDEDEQDQEQEQTNGGSQ